MNRKEAYLHFQTAIAQPAVEANQKRFYEQFSINKLQFCQTLLQGVNELLEKVLQEDPEKEIAVIRLVYLQASILDGTYQWQVMAQDKNEYLDKKPIETVIDVSPFFSCIESMAAELTTEVRKYVGNLYEGDIATYKLEAWKQCMPTIYLAGAYAFRSFRENELFQQIHRHKAFRIVVSGYMDREQVVFLHTEEDFEKAKQQLYRKGDAVQMAETQFLYRNYGGIVCKKEESRVDCKNLMFTCFAKCRIRYHQFMFCNMIGINFQNSRIDDSGFIGNPMQQADFTGAVLCNCDLHTSMFYGGEYVDGQITPGIFSVSFRNTKLDRVNFSYCDLRNCDFSGSQMNEVIFEHAKMQGTRIDEGNRNKLTLSQEQQEEIIWGQDEERRGNE